MARARWTAEDIPDLSGKTMIVTGANGGLGYETALQLARHGAHVVLACRDLTRASDAIGAIRASHPGATLEPMRLDLASLESVRKFADAFLTQHTALHVLCNNAGVMALPLRRTAEGYEMQFGTNHLGHFALTGLLLRRLLETPGARVVNVSSYMHRGGRMRFDDLQAERGYRKWQAYAQSKLANLLFTYELRRCLDAAGAALISVASHPGYAGTGLQVAGPRMQGSRLLEGFWRGVTAVFAQDAARGALPTLYASVSPEVEGGDFIGPDRFQQMRGHPTKVRASGRARDVDTAARLWQVSEKLTDIHYAFD